MHSSFFDEIHDTHRLLFLAPILYAGYHYKIKGATIAALVTAAACIPRALLLSPYPNSIQRTIIFVMMAGVIGCFIGLMRVRHLNTLFSQRQEKAKIIPVDSKDEIFVAGDLEVNFTKRLTKRGGRVIRLTPKEYELLSYLVQNTGKALKHMEMLRSIWGPEYGQESEYLRTFIWQLRRKIEDNPSDPRFILTEPGMGYRFVKPEDYH